MTQTQPYRFRALGIVCLVSLGTAMALGLFGPRVITPPGQMIAVPPWLFWTTLGFGAVATVTVPFAWRWLLVRRR